MTPVRKPDSVKRPPVSTPVVFVAALLSTACTAVDVKPVDTSLDLRHVCIEHNPRVQVSDFVGVLQDGFDRHGVSSEVLAGRDLDRCEFVLTYTALRSWDMAPYLSHAELRLRQRGRLVASADYHLRGKGGFSLAKWGGTRGKMDPVIDELLGGRKQQAPARDEEIMIPNEVFDRIVALDERRRSGEITEAEFEIEKQKILGSL